MAETKQGGFHAFEQRVHQIEEEDREAERKSNASEGAGKDRRTMPEEKGAKREPPRK